MCLSTDYQSAETCFSATLGVGTSAYEPPLLWLVRKLAQAIEFMLIGEYKHTLDPKKRLSLPSKWRKELGKKLVVTRGLDNCLFV